MTKGTDFLMPNDKQIEAVLDAVERLDLKERLRIGLTNGMVKEAREALQQREPAQAVDHREEAVAKLAVAYRTDVPEMAPQFIAAAQVHATLALVDEQAKTNGWLEEIGYTVEARVGGRV